MSQTITQTASPDLVESFFGVYLLYSINPKYRGRTYIGYTVNPNRRISQHNKGCASGGARKTNNRGPWEMVLIVHGFPNDISALRFEWAWQHPQRSRRLRHVMRKKPREKDFSYRLRILLEMLRMGPWNKLPLTIRWLVEEYQQDFQANSCSLIDNNRPGDTLEWWKTWNTKRSRFVSTDAYACHYRTCLYQESARGYCR
uniref:GIY-YIG domain-containing protein n=1 Tax=Homalodisca liturata TaxID=320908 RepID=A0A1B6IUC2_9HEMI